jgi:hypothetical protein
MGAARHNHDGPVFFMGSRVRVLISSLVPIGCYIARIAGAEGNREGFLGLIWLFEALNGCPSRFVKDRESLSVADISFSAWDGWRDIVKPALNSNKTKFFNGNSLGQGSVLEQGCPKNYGEKTILFFEVYLYMFQDESMTVGLCWNMDITISS